ncbi:MAG: alanine--tRNA ligase [Candidatus Bathyarchaeia archaeon]
MEIKEEEFSIPFFKENNFVRKRCKTCGSYFWTQDIDRENCGDAPCEEYKFIGNRLTRKSFELNEMRKTFLSFFEKNGHEVIKPYPVVARWRDDVYFVGASIYDFQPYVTEGITPPPANPLVISQPCLRFTDIDNVGPTAGRHLVIFEMGGAHAFNYPDKKVYWKDETVRFHHELLTKELGVESDLITYKEHFWSGGGNAGPDVEACIGGLEISTLVFMKYKSINDRFVEMPIKTVDTGYGIERWTWLSKGSPSGFHAVYEPILDKILEFSGLKVDEKLITSHTKLSASALLEGFDKKTLSEKVSEELGIDFFELKKIFSSIENAYAIADHTKALVFLLSEGIVPSNVGEGYLARLLLRRIMRASKPLGIEKKLEDLLEAQISFWSKDFPALKDASDYIFEILDIEKKKYYETVNKGLKIVKRLSKELSEKGKKEISTEQLISLYESNGLVPELVEESASKEGIKVRIPENFFSILAQSHVPTVGREERGPTKILEEILRGLPPTKLLYYEFPYMERFSANVLKVIDDKYVILDQTCFYPEGGGQRGDTGVLSSEESHAKVIDTQKIGNIVVHAVEGKGIKEGDSVNCKIDWNRRESLMKHHTATHIVLGAARRVLGNHVWQAGSQLELEKSRLDITHYKRLGENDVKTIEKLAFQVIMQDIPVEIELMPREKAEKTYGFRLYQGGVVPGSEIRVVRIGDWDVEACGGIHCKSTSEVGLVKILQTERIQDGVERITFTHGLSALSNVQERETKLERIVSLLKIQPERLEESISGLIEREKNLTREVKRLKLSLASIEAKNLLFNSKKIGDFKLIVREFTDRHEDELIMLANKMSDLEPSLVAVLYLVNDNARIIVKVGDKAVKSGVNAGEMTSELARAIGGSGSGKPFFGQGGSSYTEKVGEIPSLAEKILEGILKRNRPRK